jgi:transaldolase
MVKIFLDGCDALFENAENPVVDGFTSNPSLMLKAGIKDYEGFAKDVLEIIKVKPVSFEVLSDDFDDMFKQAMLISSWGDNVYVKIPVTNSRGESSLPVIERLILQKVKVNVTAVTHCFQVKHIIPVLEDSIISVFSGRLADNWISPELTILKIRKLIDKDAENKKIKILWASTREVYNIKQAEYCGCDIITISSDILKKYERTMDDAHKISLDVINQFFEDGKRFCLRVI